jgi:hypothetical protein
MLCTIPYRDSAILATETPLDIAECEAILAHYDERDRIALKARPQRCRGTRCIVYHGSICLEGVEGGLITPAVVWFDRWRSPIDRSGGV